MELITIESWPYFLLRASKIGFTFFTIICIIAMIFPFSSIKREFANINAAKNFVIAFVSIIDIILMSMELYDAYANQSDYEYFAFAKTVVYFQIMYFIAMPVFWIIGVSFFWSKPRRSWMLTAIALLAIHVDFVIDIIFKLFKDYQPSSWETYYDEVWYYPLVEIIAFSILVLFSYWFLAKRKKLPFDSSWIR